VSHVVVALIAAEAGIASEMCRGLIRAWCPGDDMDGYQVNGIPVILIEVLVSR
jgi:hypothetical protein